MSNSNDMTMKNIKRFLFIVVAFFALEGCDKDFVEINTNPYAVTDIDPALLFAGAQLTPLGGVGIRTHDCTTFRESAQLWRYTRT